jgi:serine/threonine protein kinase
MLKRGIRFSHFQKKYLHNSPNNLHAAESSEYLLSLSLSLFPSRDLAARNILIDENKNLKISDFGLSRNGIYVNTRNKKVSSISAFHYYYYSCLFPFFPIRIKKGSTTLAVCGSNEG